MNLIKMCQEGPHTFSLEEANNIIPLLERISKKHSSGVDGALQRQRYLMKSGAPEASIKAQDDIVGKNMVAWGVKVKKLGGHVMSGGYLGLDSGDGFYWSWHFGEKVIGYYHFYEETPASRRKIVSGELETPHVT